MVLARLWAPQSVPISNEWERGYCPICGSRPLLAFLQEDGKREVVCSACETIWAVPRLFCLNCENRDQKTMGYFFVETHEGARLDVCSLCRHYIKTLDLRKKGSSLIPVLEDLLTTHLDLWAQKKGYKKLPLLGSLMEEKKAHEDPLQGLAGKG